LKNYSIALILAVSFIGALSNYAIGAGGGPSCVYSIEDGKIILYSGESAKAVPVTGVISSHYHGDDGIYYISIKTDSNASETFVGCVDLQSGTVRYEKKLSFDSDKFILGKLMVSEGIAYLLAEPRSPSGAGRVLTRINLNSMEISNLPDVMDYHADKQDLILLAKRGTGMAVIRNEIVVPITMAGQYLPRIGEVVNGRMVLITNGDVTEIIDIISGRDVYGYSNKKELQMPDEYNLAVDIHDSKVSEQDDREMVFYKVFLDGIESGRTDSGPAALSREFRVKIDVNKYHILKLERWILNAAKGRYERENNIRQPKTEQIYMPMNRIVKINITCDGKNYHYETVPVYK
jgi:hypothetical protein